MNGKLEQGSFQTNSEVRRIVWWVVQIKSF